MPRINNNSLLLVVSAILAITLTIIVVGASASNNNNNNNKNNNHKKRPTSATKTKIHVHFIPHSHLDTQWLKTSDQLLYGLNNTIQPSAVNLINDAVFSNLLLNENRRFTYDEMFFFVSWWNQQSESVQAQVKQLVAEKRLQWAGAGWCQPDEASPNFVDMIDTFTVGHRFLKRTFGASGSDSVQLQAGWSLDPFGHSAFNALLQAMMFQVRDQKQQTLPSIHFARADFRDAAFRAANKQREFVWSPCRSLPHYQTYAQMLVDSTYGPPSGFQWSGIQDLLQEFVLPTLTSKDADAFFCDDPSMPQYNVNERVAEFYKVAEHYASVTLGNSKTAETHVMMMMGSDFEYEVASSWYVNMDKLINALAATSGGNSISNSSIVTASYSTPNDYVEAKLASIASSAFPTYKEHDFFPYADGPSAMWAGYFGSRPALKRYISTLSSYWIASRQLRAALSLPTGEIPAMTDALGLAQHHDSITGTSKQHSTFDLQRRLNKAYVEDSFAFQQQQATAKLFGGNALFHCPRSNESECDITALNFAAFYAIADIPVVVWNPAPHATNRWVRIPVPKSTIVASGGNVVSWSNCYAAPPPVRNYASDNKNSKAMDYELSIELALPAAGYATFFLSNPPNKSNNNNRVHANKKNHHDDDDHHHHHRRPLDHLSSSSSSHNSGNTQVFYNEELELTFVSGLLVSVRNKYSYKVLGVQQDYCYYNAYASGLKQENAKQKTHKKFSYNDNAFQNAGAYIMRTESPHVCAPLTPSDSNVTVVSSHKDFLVLEADFGWITQRIILSNGQGGGFEIEYTVGEVPISDGKGKEVFMRFRTNVTGSSSSSSSKSSSSFSSSSAAATTFYTDSNRRLFIKRELNGRPGWPGPFVPADDDPVARNMYPTQAIYMGAGAGSGSSNNSGADDLGIGITLDAATAAGSTAPGELLVLVQRRLLHDDMRGVFEPLNETEDITPYAPGLRCFVPFLFGAECGKHSGRGLVVRGSLRVFVAETKSLVYATRKGMDEMLFAKPQPFYLHWNWTNSFNNTYSLFSNAGGLNPQLQLVTLQQINETLVVLRLAHAFEVDDAVDYKGTTAYPVAVDLKTLFAPTAFGGRNIKTVREMTVSTLDVVTPVVTGNVTISPMEIRTFEIDLNTM